jgi:hypothetical protein
MRKMAIVYCEFSATQPRYLEKKLDRHTLETKQRYHDWTKL